ncbi:MAG: MotA/TolQ/ExbB proton channel family protein [Planctomycetota bacterium]
MEVHRQTILQHTDCVKKQKSEPSHHQAHERPLGWRLDPRWLLKLGFALIIFATLSLNTSTVMAQDDGAATEATSFFSIILSGGITGLIMIVILLALSVTAAYLIFEHLMTIRRNDLMPDGLADHVRQCLMSGDVKAAQAACNERPSFLSFVLMHGISELEFGWSSVEKSLEDALAEQSARLFRKIEYLSVIGNIAPMVGLLGTVIGMIIAFQNVASTQGTASAPQLAEGIYQALVTTVGGLIVAIPSIGAFAIFRNRIDQFVAEAAYLAQHVFTPLRRRAKK